MASFPTTTPTKPAGITSGLTISAIHVDDAWDEIIAISDVMRGVTGGNLSVKPASNAGVPLGLRGVASQTADLFQIGSSASATDRLTFSAAGQMTLVATGASTGLKIGTSLIFSNTTDLRLSPGTNGTTAFTVRDSAGTGVALSADTTNLRVGIGSTGAPSTRLHIESGATPTTAAGGIQIGTEASGAAVNFYRSAANTGKTDAALVVGGKLNALSTLTFGAADDVTIATVSGVPTSTIYTGTTSLRVLTNGMELRKSNGESFLILSSASGERWKVTVNDTGSLIVTGVTV